MTKEPMREGFRIAQPAPSEKDGPAIDASVMGADILVKGDIEAVEDLHIEGRVIGDVRCATLILGPSSVVTGRITADRVRVSGLVEGAIETKDLAVEAGARVKGEISFSRIRIANGGVIEGMVKHVPAPEEASGDLKLKLVEKTPPPEPAAAHYFE